MQERTLRFSACCAIAQRCCKQIAFCLGGRSVIDVTVNCDRVDYFFEQDQIQQHIAEYFHTFSEVLSEPKALKRYSYIT